MIDDWHLHKNCLRIWGDLAKLIVAKGYKKLPKVPKIAQSGHTDDNDLAWSIKLSSAALKLSI